MRYDMLRNLAVCALMFVSMLSAGQQAMASPAAQKVSPGESRRNEKALLRYVWPALKAAGKSGRIYYRAVCQADENFPIAFSRIEAQPPRENEIGLAAIRDVFRND
jgi:hypothetical protein